MCPIHVFLASIHFPDLYNTIKDSKITTFILGMLVITDTVTTGRKSASVRSELVRRTLTQSPELSGYQTKVSIDHDKTLDVENVILDRQ